MTIEELQKRVEALERRTSHPLPINFVQTIEQVKFNSLTANKLFAGSLVITDLTTIADRTYTTGAKITVGGNAGTITTQSGLITAITEAT